MPFNCFGRQRISGEKEVLMSREMQLTREHSSDRRSQLAQLSPRPVLLRHVILTRYVLSDEEEGVL